MTVAKRIEDAIDRLKDNPPFRQKTLPKSPAPSPKSMDHAGLSALQRELIVHMITTYRLLRRGMGWISIAYPLALVVLGLVLFDVAWQPSISDYYYALPRGLDLPKECLAPSDVAGCMKAWQAKAVDMTFPLRALFCGGLIAVGVFLILYKGTSWLEDWALNLAGVFAIGVAIFPMNKMPFSSNWPTWWHFASAVLLFLTMGFISRFCAKDTLRFFDPGSPEIAYYTKLYKRLALAMLGVIVAGAVYGFAAKAIDAVFPWALFCIEAAGVVIFGSYWVIKSKEISKHDFRFNFDA